MMHLRIRTLFFLAAATSLAFLVALPTVVVAAEECGVLPADPSHLQGAEENPDIAYDLSEKGYLAFERKDFQCAAFYNAEAYRHQPDPVLMQNVANALKEGKQYDAAARYARATLTLTPEQPEIDAANALLAEVEPPLSGPAFVQITLAEYEADAMVVEWIRYEPGDAPLLKKGTYAVTVERLGQAPAVESITVPKPVELPPPPPPESSTWKLWAGVATGGVGLALLGTALYIDLDVGSKIDDYDGLRDCLQGSAVCPDETRTQDDYNALGEDIASQTDVELMAAIGGGVLTVVGGGLLAWHFLGSDDHAAAEEQAMTWSVAPVVTSDGGRLFLQIAF